MDKTLLKLAIKLIDLGWNVRFNTSNEMFININNVDKISFCISPLYSLNPTVNHKYSIYDCHTGQTYDVKFIKDLEKTINEVFNIAYKNAIKNDLDLLMAGEIQHIINVQKQKNKPFHLYK